MVDLSAVRVDQRLIAAVCERYGIARLMIFGSVARGSANPASDLDILYELLPEHRLGWEIEDLSDELSELFGRRVDLVSRSALHRSLRAAVLAEAEILDGALHPAT